MRRSTFCPLSSLELCSSSSDFPSLLCSSSLPPSPLEVVTELQQPNTEHPLPPTEAQATADRTRDTRSSGRCSPASLTPIHPRPTLNWARGCRTSLSPSWPSWASRKLKKTVTQGCVQFNHDALHDTLHICPDQTDVKFDRKKKKPSSSVVLIYLEILSMPASQVAKRENIEKI